MIKMTEMIKVIISVRVFPSVTKALDHLVSYAEWSFLLEWKFCIFLSVEKNNKTKP